MVAGVTVHPARAARLGAVLASVVYGSALYLAGIHAHGVLRYVLVYSPTAIGLGVVAFDIKLWYMPGVSRLAGRPRIGGTWLGHLTPNRESHIPDGGNRGPIPAALIVEQTYWSVAITLLTKESSSVSTSAALQPDGAHRGRHVLSYVYRNDPGQKHRPRSMPHTGAARMQITGSAPGTFTGSYWTDRLTAGDMEFKRIDGRTNYETLGQVRAAAR